MSARQDIEKYLGEWQRLTQAEALAIDSAAWPRVTQVQSAKSSLRDSLTAALEQFAAETGGPLPADHPLRLEASRLMSLESRNAALLAEQFRRAETKKKALTDSLQNLRRLRKAYGNGAE